MASQPGAWYAFPWEGLGCAKYVVLAPFVVALACGWDDADSWSWHMLALCALRYLHAQLWNTAARTHAVSAGTRITAKPVEFKQVDRESNWDDYILLQALVMTAVHNAPGLGFGGWPAYSGRGLVQLLLFHAGPTEFAYYWLHRALHWHPLYQRYHSHHHASFVAEPITGAPPVVPRKLVALEPLRPAAPAAPAVASSRAAPRVARLSHGTARMSVACRVAAAPDTARSRVPPCAPAAPHTASPWPSQARCTRLRSTWRTRRTLPFRFLAPGLLVAPAGPCFTPTSWASTC
jgi:hypothetical protein